MKPKPLYRIRADVDRYMWLDPVTSADQNWLTQSRGLVLPDEVRQPLRLAPLSDNPSRTLPAGDFPRLKPPMLCFSHRAWSVIGPLIGANGRTFDLEITAQEHSPFVGFLVDCHEACLDEQHSDLLRFRSSGGIMEVRTCVLQFPSSKTIPTIFREDELFADVFVDQRFADAWKDAGLEGMLFEPVEVRSAPNDTD